jgi:hypothetical protein
MTAEKQGLTDALVEEAARERMVYFIREKSKEGQFALRKDLLRDLRDHHLLKEQEPEGQEPTDPVEALLKKTMELTGDLKELPGKEGEPRYYSSIYMSEAYVRILLRKEEDPLILMAETIRENSALYPRPVPLTTFVNSPFDLSREEILVCLKKMTEREEFKDIRQTTTSIGTVYLYSTLHLEADYASYLAQWLDVGQYENP